MQTALIRGGLENITLRDIRAAGGQREDDQTLLEWTRAHGSITRRDVMALLNLSDTAAYLRLRRLVGRRELEQVGKKYYLPGTVVPEEKQWEVISAYLQEAGFALLPGCGGAPARRKAQDGRYPAADGEGRPTAAV